MSKKEVEELLKKGAYGALMEDDEDGDEFCEEDIDQILQRRTQIIQIEAGEKNSTFAKVSLINVAILCHYATTRRRWGGVRGRCLVLLWFSLT